MPLDSAVSRRDILRIARRRRGFGGRRRGRRWPAKRASARLIDEARALAEPISQRIDFISARAARHALPGLHADRRAAAAGTIRACATTPSIASPSAKPCWPRRIARDLGEFETALRDDPLSQRHRELARAQSLFLRVGPAQCREQDLPRGRHGRRGRHRKDGLLAQASSARRRFAMRVIPRATFLANKAHAGERRYRRLRDAAAEPRLFPHRLCRLRRATANCCCGMPRKAGTACSTSAWTASSRSIACAMSRCCGRRSRRPPSRSRSD